jgi:hypothetical protein
MKLRLTLFAFGAALFAVSFVCLSTRAHVLTAAEAQAVTGSVNNKKCNASATCVEYNHDSHPTINCPTDSNLCFECTLGSNPWELCIAWNGQNCTEKPLQPNDCGSYREGSCTGPGGSCVWLYTIGACADADHCETP